MKRFQENLATLGVNASQNLATPLFATLIALIASVGYSLLNAFGHLA